MNPHQWNLKQQSAQLLTGHTAKYIVHLTHPQTKRMAGRHDKKISNVPLQSHSMTFCTNLNTTNTQCMCSCTKWVPIQLHQTSNQTAWNLLLFTKPFDIPDFHGHRRQVINASEQVRVKCKFTQAHHFTTIFATHNVSTENRLKLTPRWRTHIKIMMRLHKPTMCDNLLPKLWYALAPPTGLVVDRFARCKRGEENLADSHHQTWGNS